MTSPEEAVATRGWWRRNAVGLVAVGVLAPLTVGIVAWNEWQEVFLYRPIQAVEPAADGTVSLASATWGPVTSTLLDASTGLLVPEGAQVVAVKIPVAPDATADEPIKCDRPVLIEQSTGRQWTEMRTELGLPWSAEEPLACDSTIEGDFAIFVPFIVPEDATGPFWVDIDVRENPRFVRFSIEP